MDVSKDVQRVLIKLEANLLNVERRVYTLHFLHKIKSTWQKKNCSNLISFAWHGRLGGTLAAARPGWAQESVTLAAADASCVLQVTHSSLLVIHLKLC